ncbi:MAG: TRAP transporter large permease subunit [Aestuariivita sp.]|nr:TRAP transporter large permease subunit [Aestuariivita sp.]MCY4203752.1 TRAP transporter large permease subunit [Aestuariivita sp.]MCY4287061.1 TRAP transporter large permease subunit [Aestuariivita sp.]MCY4345480.1 TRAP transporter large permease subunit [Aestuariivita sp.]
MFSETAQVAFTIVAFLFLLLGSGTWIALSLLGVGWVGLTFFTSVPVEKSLATSIWQTNASWTLAALPLFIWMGEILFRAKLSETLFRGLTPWLGWLPGRLLHVNVLGSGLFAAVCGSSAATCATVGRMSLPELDRLGYDRTLAIGSLAGSATLGLLIPPSIIMIVYGVAADVSIVRLFLAGVLPGLLIMSLFSGYIVVRALLSSRVTSSVHQQLSLSEKFRDTRGLIPTVLLILGVIMSIYAGIATATEAAAGGVVGSLILAAYSRTLSPQMLTESLMSATQLSCMIFLILSGAAFLTTSFAYLGIPAAVASWVGDMNLHPYTLMFALCILYIILGCFIEGISMIVLTTAVVLPLVSQAGFDLLWFGIFVIIVVEAAQITPPLGFNLFVIQGLTGISIFRVAWAALPFFILLITGAAIITLFPAVALWLPSTMDR